MGLDAVPADSKYANTGSVDIRIGDCRLPDPLKTALSRGFMLLPGLQDHMILSLGAQAFTYITHTPLINGLEPIENAMGIVADMSIVQLGSIPLAYLFIYLLRRPLAAAGRLLHINDVAVAATPISCVNVLSAFMLIKDMDRRGS